MPSLAVINLVLTALLTSVLLSDHCGCSLSHDEPKSEVSADMVPMVLSEGRTYFAYVEPTLSNFHRNLEASTEAMSQVEIEVDQPKRRKQEHKLVEIWNLSTMNLELLDRGAAKPDHTKASLKVRSTDKKVGPVEGLSQIFALGEPGKVLCLKKASFTDKCMTEFQVDSDNGPLIFDCNKDYSAITDVGRDSDCGGLHNFLPHDLNRYYRITEHLKLKHNYRRLTGRDYLGGDLRTSSTQLSLWPAEYYGQEHNVVVTVIQQEEEAAEQRLITLKVLSRKPRVFEIENFLSQDEIQKIMEAAKENFQEDISGKQRAVLDGQVSTLIKSICNRASAALHGNDVLSKKNFDSIVVERMIEASTDFGSVPSDRGFQLVPKSVYMRYATLVLFLNDSSNGGELTFPLSGDENTNTRPLAVVPKKGTAVMFYSMLPDGNLDERSVWEIESLLKGEQWVATLTIAEDLSFS